jgi:HSP20 family molecular chaperone IbpA
MNMVPTAARSDADTLLEEWRTAASPPAFAPPLGIDDDGSSLCVAFDVHDIQLESLAVEVTENAVVIHGDADPQVKHESKVRRYFTLPSGMDPTTTQTRYDGNVLMVRMFRAGAEQAEADPAPAEEATTEGEATETFEGPMLTQRALPSRAHSWPYTIRRGRRARSKGEGGPR